MKKLILLMTMAMLTIPLSIAQQRYVDEIFTDAEIGVQTGIKYATNVDWLISDFTNQSRVVADMTELKTDVALMRPHAQKFYNPADTSTVVKVTDLKFDIYAPAQSADSVRSRPLVIYVHTGNFLPKGLNQSTTGTRSDSAAVEICTQLAKRGYVAASIDYRYGWLPVSSDPWVRRGTLLNAVYRVLHDTKMAVRYLRSDAQGPNMYGINPDQIVLFGEGSGAYVANVYGSLDRFAELQIPKLINPNTGKSVIDTNMVGNIAGYNGFLNLYVDGGVDATVHAVVTAGGAFADTSWLEAGDPPLIAIQCVRDPLAPFHEGTVVVPTTGEDVVDVQGANLSVPKANALGNNDSLHSSSHLDPYSMAARGRYGKTYAYIFPAPLDKMTISSNGENMFPILRPLGGSLFENESSPWQWWDPNDPQHAKNIGSNPGMGPAKGKAYCDTIVGYMTPRIATLFGYVMSVRDASIITGITVAPNPASGEADISLENGEISTLIVLDAMGREVYRYEDVASRNITLSVNSWESGLYFVRIITPDGQGTIKLIRK